MSWKCYLLATVDGGFQKTYVGVTPDLSRRLSVRGPLQRRLTALQTLLAHDRATSAAIPYENWSEPPEFHVETERDLPFL